MSVEDLFRWFYELGLNTDVAKEVDIQYLKEFIEQADFQRMIEDAIKNPNSIPSDMVVSVDDENNKVTLTAECAGYDCSLSPQREDHCMSESDKNCTVSITMKQFNQTIGVK